VRLLIFLMHHNTAIPVIFWLRFQDKTGSAKPIPGDAPLYLEGPKRNV
jgi:hypothetical protein